MYSLSFYFPFIVHQKSQIHLVAIWFVLLINTRFGLLAWICDPFVSKSQRSLFVSFSRKNSGLCYYHLVVWSNFNLLHNSQWITFPTQSSLVLYSFCAGLLHLLIIILLSWEFFLRAIADGSYRSLSDHKPPQISWTLLCILTDLNNAVVWMVSTHPYITQSPSPCISPLVTVPRAPVKIGSTVNFMFHSFFCSLVRSSN